MEKYKGFIIEEERLANAHRRYDSGYSLKLTGNTYTAFRVKTINIKTKRTTYFNSAQEAKKAIDSRGVTKKHNAKINAAMDKLRTQYVRLEARIGKLQDLVGKMYNKRHALSKKLRKLP